MTDDSSCVLVTSAFHGKRLDKALALVMPDADLKERRRAWERGWVLVNGFAREKNYKVKAGQRLDMVAFDLGMRPEEVDGLRVVKEHGAYAGVYKPPGMPVRPAPGTNEKSVRDLAEQFWPDHPPRPLNDLDREATGLVLLALDRKAENAYLTIDSKFVSTVHYALVRGCLEGQRTIKNKLTGRGPVEILDEEIPTFLRWTIVTPVKYLSSLGATLVLAHVHKGGHHQVRAHLAAVGHPIQGDTLYGPDEEGPLHLHCYRIELPRFFAECDPEWKNVPFILPE